MISGGGTGDLQPGSNVRNDWAGERAAVDGDDAAEAIERLLPDLRDLGVQHLTIDELIEMAGRLRGLAAVDRGGVNSARIEQEYREALRLLEQLEIAVSASSSSSQNTRANGSGSTGDYRKEVADYYRDLSESSRSVVVPTVE